MSQVTDYSSFMARRPVGRHLYVLFAVHTRRCKIGSSSHVANRFRNLQNSGADDLVLWAWAADCGKYEADMHGLFGDYRIHGEWFLPEVTTLIARAVPYQSATSAELAKMARKEGGRYRPRCPDCGSRAKSVWKRVGARNIARCPKCNRCRASVRVQGVARAA